MKANELRIGNLLQGDKIQLANQGIYSDGIFAITGYGISEFELGRLLKAKPIPLTEEWLLKFGFEKLTKRFRKEVNGYWYTVWDSGQFDVDNKAISFNCKYVHKLQNLYFDLTGEELTITEANENPR